MRIALMTNNYKPVVGGVPISIERLARGLRALGHEVTVFAPTYEERVSLEEEEEDVLRYATCMKRFVGGIVLPNPFDRRIEKEFETNSYDIIHVHHPMLIGGTAVRLSRKYKIPLVFTYHTRYEEYAKIYTKGLVRLKRVMPFYLRNFMKNCQLVLAPTAGMEQYLTADCGVSPEKVGVLPTGIEEGNFAAEENLNQEIRRRFGARHMPLLLTVSRMAQEKNVSFLLQSLKQVKELYGRPFRMLFVGDGPDREALQKQSRALGLTEEAVFTGAIPNEQIAPYFAAADAFLFASKTETQGIVVLEAFAGSTPVIALRASGVEDLVEDDVDGFLTEENTEAYAWKTAQFLKGLGWYEKEKPLEGLDQYEKEKPLKGLDQYEKEEPSWAAERRVGENERVVEMKQNARRKAALYREEEVARKAISYYNVAYQQWNGLPQGRLAQIRLKT